MQTKTFKLSNFFARLNSCVTTFSHRNNTGLLQQNTFSAAFITEKHKFQSKERILIKYQVAYTQQE